MSEAAAIEQAFRSTLPSKLHDNAVRLAQILADVAADKLAPDKATEQIQAEPALLESIRDLDGKVVKTPQSVLSFGQASQAGDITIGSVVGGHQISIIILPPPPLPPQPLPPQPLPPPPTPTRSGLPLWALVVIAGSLVLWSSASLLPPSVPKSPTGAAVPAAATPAPAPAVSPPTGTFPAPQQPTLTMGPPGPVVQPTSAVRAFAERCIAEQQLDLPVERIFLVEAGANIFILGPHDRRDQPIALALSEDGQPLALVVLDIVQGQSYIARAVLDAGCQLLPDSSFSNAEPSRLHMLQAWDNLLLCLASGAYRIRVGAPSQTPVEILSRLVGGAVNCS